MKGRTLTLYRDDSTVQESAVRHARAILTALDPQKGEAK